MLTQKVPRLLYMSSVMCLLKNYYYFMSSTFGATVKGLLYPFFVSVFRIQKFLTKKKKNNEKWFRVQSAD